MTQYIDKADIVAEIERLKEYAQTLGDNAINSSMQQFYDGMVECCNCLLNILNTLEVKEVDLEKESRHYLLHQHKSPLATDAFIKKAKKWFNRKNGIVVTDTKAFFEEFIDYMGIE